MTISTSTARAQHTTNSAVTNYAFNFRVLVTSQLSVSVVNSATYTETPLALGTDYTVTGAGSTSGGAIAMTAAGRAKAGTGLRLVILRNMPFIQDIDFRIHELTPAEAFELGLDTAVMERQQLRESLKDTVKTPPGSEPVTSADILRWKTEAQEAAQTATGQAAAAAQSASSAGQSAASAGQNAAAAIAAKDVAVQAQQAAFAAASSASADAGRAESAAAGVQDAVDAATGLYESLGWLPWKQALNSCRFTRSAIVQAMRIYKLQTA